MRTHLRKPRRILSRVALASAGVVAALGMAVSAPLTAQAASPATPSSSVAPAKPISLGPEWHYYDSYFWGADCTSVGNWYVTHGYWSAYICDGNWFRDYDLYYRY